MSHNRKGAEARVRRGIENHAIAFYKAVKKSHAENDAYEERIKDHKEYNRLYNDAQKEDFRMRRSYLRHKVEEAKRALFMSIESELQERNKADGIKEPNVAGENIV